MVRSLSDILASRPDVKKRFRFTLDDGTPHILIHAPDGFAKGETKLVRNKVYRGLFRTISVNELTFYKEGKEILDTAYQTQGIDAQVLLIVEISTSTGYAPYVELHLDFATYRSNSVSVSIQAVDSSIMEKVKNRDDVIVNLFSTTSIDGAAISSFPIGLHIPNTSINNYANYGDNSGIDPYAPVHIVPTLLSGANFNEAKTPAQIINSRDGAFFFNSLNKRKLSVKVTLDINISPVTVGTDDLSVEVYLDVYNSDDVKTQGYIVGYLNGTGGNLSGVIDNTIEVTINKGDSLVLQAKWQTEPAGNEVDYEYTYSSISQKVTETYEGAPEKDVKAFGVFEAFYRLIQLLTGENAFESEFFGRTDTPVVYPTDGVILHIIKGKLLRTTDTTFPITLKDLFQSVNSIYNVGFGYENGKFIVEDISHFFGTTVLDLSGRVSKDMIEISAAPDLIFKEIEAGYQKFGKNEANSGFEFNTKASYTTDVKSITTKLNIVSKFRADGTSIVRLLNEKDLSKDVDGDNDVFFIKSFRNGTMFQAATDEEFVMISGAVYADKSFNLELSPARNIRRWGNIISCGLSTSGILRWQDTENNSDLETDKGIGLVKESSDINYWDLSNPLYVQERIKVRVPLTNDEINTIFVNPDLVVRVGSDMQGWIDSLTIFNDSNEAEFILLRQNPPK